MKKTGIIIGIVFISCICSLLITTKVCSQNINQARDELSIANADSSKIRLLNNIAYDFYLDYEYDSCYKYAQQALIFSQKFLNSLSSEINSENLDLYKEYKAISLANLARGLIRYDNMSAADTLLKAIELIKQTDNKLEEGKMYESLGIIYDFAAMEEEALEYHLLALKAYREVSAKEYIAFQLTSVAVAHRSLGNHGDALEYLVESLNTSRELNDSTSMVEALLAMGFTYLYVERWDDALKAQHDALLIFEEMNDSLGIARIYNDMGATNMYAENYQLALEQHKKALAIRLNSTDFYYTYASYSYIGEIYETLGNYSEAIKNYKEGLEFAKRSGIKISEIYTHTNLGTAYMKSGDQKVALEHFQKVLKLSESIDDCTYETIAFTSIADIYLQRNQAQIALDWLQKAEKTAPRSGISYLTNIHQKIADSYFQLGDFRNAYLNLIKYGQYKDSASVAENLDKITTLSNRLEFENRKKLQDEGHAKLMQIKQTEIERQKVVKNFSLFGAAVVLIFAVIFFMRFVEKKRINNRLNETLSNLKSAQAQLIHSEKMASLGELTAGIAHEIQNPLNFVNNFSDLNAELIAELNEEIENGDIGEVKTIAENIAGNEEKIMYHGKRAEAIVKGMLQHSRLSTNNKQETDINALADEYLRLSYHGLRAKDKSFNADFIFNADDELPRINVFAQDIGRVLLNLINNAFYAVSKKVEQNEQGYKPTVTVSTQNLNGNIEIIVKDNGNGIPNNVLDKIFQPFFTTKPTGQGTGLGLSISYDIITKGHNGELRVNSNGKKGFTEFIIQLPLT